VSVKVKPKIDAKAGEATANAAPQNTDFLKEEM